MPNFTILTDDNFILYAIKYYENPGCISKKEFLQDLDRIKYIKRLFRRYHKKKDISVLRLRLALNHIIVLYNVFNPQAATKILFFKLEPELWPILKTFLVFLNFLPDTISGIGKKAITTSAIKLDEPVITELRKI